MKVKTLGTGSTYSKANCACVLIDDDTLIDVGPGTTKSLIRMNHNLTSIKTILLTHLHSDHIADILLLVNNLEILDFDHAIDIYAPRGTDAKFIDLAYLLNGVRTANFVSQRFIYHDIQDGYQAEFGQHTVKVFRAMHGSIEAYSFLIDKKLGITGDSSLCENIKKLAKASEALICDCSKEIGNHQHMGIDNLLELSDSNPKLRIFPTHFRDKTKAKLCTMQLNHNITIIDDGYSFTV